MIPILERKRRAFAHTGLCSFVGSLKLTKSKYRKKSLKEALSREFAIIAEIKRASPSKGKIAKIEEPGERALLYVEGGAAAISVLTDEAFEGSLADLSIVADALASTTVPVLRKDFIVHPAQLFESFIAGADAVLLIVSVLKETTTDYLKLVKMLGLEALVEVHTLEELEIAIQCGAEIIGVNQRDLSDFSMHPERYAELIGKIPEICIAVAESSKERVPGYDAILVGEALSRADDPVLQMRMI